MQGKFSLLIISIFLIGSGCSSSVLNTQNINQTNNINTNNTATSTSADTTSPINIPIKNALNRITKKPFGIKISPNDSPVEPERFSGYHTGTDFETFPDEQDTEIDIYAICDGKLIYKNYVNGYGGVAIQSCNISDQPVTVLYGHLKLDSIKPVINDKIITGDQIGYLGKGYSSDTDGERKHLHLSIHKGNEINLLGYVQSSAELKNWLNPVKFIYK